MEELTVLQRIAVSAIPMLFAITVHEAAHGFVAWRLGDPTARMLGRVTLNPVKHIDPFGTIILPLLTQVFGGFFFGWAKPVPVTPQNLRNPRRDMAIVAAAGPISNLLMALIWALLMRFANESEPTAGSAMGFLLFVSVYGVFTNVILAVLNLLPLPPLDGGRIAVSLLPGPMAWQLSRIEPYGIIIIVVLLVTHVLDLIMTPPIMFFFELYKYIGGLV